MYRSFTLGAAAMVLSALLAGAALADGAGGGFRGLTALQKGFANPVPTADPCILINSETASGLAVGIGPVEWESVEVVDLASNPDCLAPAGAEIEGEFVITTESGDHITGDYKTVAQIDAAANRITALGHYRVTGGTGRFTRAKGRGVIKADGNFQPPFDLTGELIAQPASGDDDD